MATTTNYGWTTPDDTDLVKLGADAIRVLGASIDTSMNTALGTKKAGLVLLNDTSFSAVASSSLPVDSFTSTYDNYKFICVWSTSASVSTGFRLRTAGSDNSTSNYAVQQLQSDSTSTISTRATGQTSWALTGSGAFQYVIMDILRPNLAEKTLMNFTSATLADTTSLSLRSVTGLFNASTVFDSLSLITASGTVTGNYQLYGYNV